MSRYHWYEDRADYVKSVPKIHGDAVVCSDVHIPFHNAKLLERMMKVGHLDGVTQLVIGGDLVDWHEISRHRKHSGQTPDVRGVLKKTLKVLVNLLDVFHEVWILKGNHDDRLQKLIETATESADGSNALLDTLVNPEDRKRSYRDRYRALLDDFGKRHIPEYHHRIHWLACPAVHLDGPRGLEPWRLTHPDEYSRTAPNAERKLWSKFVQPILGTHGHTMGLSVAPNGLHPVVQFGAMTSYKRHLYLSEQETSHPFWIEGFCTLLKGRLTLYTDNPYLTDWTDIDAIRLPRS